ncbi:thiol:disulfide interchange protein DsbA/DsbL [Pseudorhodoferax sp. Leaf267]|uniref:thiol:disulfide interchange protein DsbA/DsbL n=1 Tax=Pseudorhodoferax sp. Leaf267 TaxID=1736316 RepID=UPI0006FF5519|nr:thiol:disulfide interchange protein DsbA/DsbL [Pseudorhodoferax sp. Leaf267]KQP12212.1 disulfide bond formation protein DsbA [Pseudorhodoferax sp. Leaf267]
MKRREFSKAWTSGLAVSALGLTQAPLALAQAGGGSAKAGTDYLVLDKPAAVESAPGKIEVVEFFWYACPHCNAFEPRLEDWVKKLPKDVAFRRSPVAFRNDFVPLQKLYYTLEALNLVESLHRKAFYAIHVEKQQLNRDETVLAWAAKQPGVDQAKFTDTYNSFGVSTKVRKATQLQDAYKLAGVPALGINGRYYTDGTLAQSMDRALVVTDQLVAEQRGKNKS